MPQNNFFQLARFRNHATSPIRAVGHDCACAPQIGCYSFVTFMKVTADGGFLFL
jgi:hypothetical protein